LNQTNPKDPNSEKEDLVRFVAQGSTPVFLTSREIERESENDPELVSVLWYIHTGDWSQCKIPGYVSVKNELCIMGKLVLRGDRIVIPQSLRRSVVESAHEGHQFIVKTKGRLRTKVWWSKMDADAERACKSCHECQVVGQYSPPEPMQRTEPPTGPWQDLAVDLMGPMPGGENLLVVVDYYSRYYEVVVMRSTTSPKIIAALTEIFADILIRSRQIMGPSLTVGSSRSSCVSAELSIDDHHQYGRKPMARLKGKTGSSERP